MTILGNGLVACSYLLLSVVKTMLMRRLGELFLPLTLLFHYTLRLYENTKVCALRVVCTYV